LSENHIPFSSHPPGEISGLAPAVGVSADPDHPVLLVPHHRDPLEALARAILERHRPQLPDLSRLTVLLPDPGPAARLHERLLDLAQIPTGALLGPRIVSLRAWALEHADGPVPDEQRRTLMLFEALREHPGPFGGLSTWHLVEELVGLFDELSLEHAEIPDDPEAFQVLVAQAYAPKGAAPLALGSEAALVHQLWCAWHQQHLEEGLREREAAYLDGLARGLAALAPQERIYVAGLEHASRAERAWARDLVHSGHGTVLVHATLPVDAASASDTPAGRLLAELDLTPVGDSPASARAGLLDELFDRSDLDLAARARRYHNAHAQSPLADALQIAIADDLEQEAGLIDIQIRLWLARGLRRIGIVTEDRRLARRLRALLERSGISVADAGGWALSTTSAAAALERWLECIEEDFAHQVLLDVLKSPFVFGAERETQLHTVYRLEQDVIQHENIARGLGRYRAAVRRRQQRLAAFRSDYPEQILALLDHLEHAAAPLTALQRGSSRPAGRFLAALRESLTRLGLADGLGEDPAGQSLFDVLERMEAASNAGPLRLRWPEFRAWLGRNLERHYFRPPSSPGPIVLTDAVHSRLQCFEALVLARLDERHFPGPAEGGSFFNDAVRAQLELPTWHDRVVARLVDFRRLLEAAPEVLLTTPAGDGDQALRPSPWLELLGIFHRLAYDSDLQDQSLRRLCGHPNARPFEGDTRERPEVPTRPAPPIPPAMIPAELSVSAHQTLVGCPYRFYTRYCLGLQPPEEISEALSKADYGMLVHRCLQALHSDVPELPGPLSVPLNVEHRAEAIGLLERISAAVFHAALEDSFEHRGWLQRWQGVIPRYIDWEIGHGGPDGGVATELALVAELETDLRLRGRLDRVEHRSEGMRIVDYKTGATASRAQVLRGEDVQIASYAILAPEAQRIEYLKIDHHTVVPTAMVRDEELSSLRERVGERLRYVYARLRRGEGAIANGEDGTCRYCDMGGLCRRAAWAAAPANTTPAPSGRAATKEKAHE
jgi:ATP-dependent helicase/nuclease subunit B